MSLQARYKKPEPPSNGPQSFNIESAAAYLGTHPWTIRVAIREGKLQATRIGKARGYNIERTELERWARSARFSIVRSRRLKKSKAKLPPFMKPDADPSFIGLETANILKRKARPPR